MPWVSAILAVLQSMPKLLDLVDRLAKAISQGIDDLKRDAALRDEQKAANLAKQKKDTSGLEDLFDPTRPKVAPLPPPAPQPPPDQL